MTHKAYLVFLLKRLDNAKRKFDLVRLPFCMRLLKKSGNFFIKIPCKTHRQMSPYYRGTFFFCEIYEVLE